MVNSLDFVGSHHDSLKVLGGMEILEMFSGDLIEDHVNSNQGR